MEKSKGHVKTAILFGLLVVCFLMLPKQRVQAETRFQIYMDDVVLPVDTKTPPFIENGRTFVPIRVIAENFDYEVEWVDAKQEVVIYNGVDVHRLRINDKTATKEVNGVVESHIIDAPPVLRAGSTFVPLRYLSENMGAEVVWEPSEYENRIYIYREIEYASLTVDGKTIEVGEPKEKIYDLFGQPTMDTVYNFPFEGKSQDFQYEWLIYNDDYKQFIAFAVNDTDICGFYTSALGFTTDIDIREGDIFDESLNNTVSTRDPYIYADTILTEDETVNSLLYMARNKGFDESLYYNEEENGKKLDIIQFDLVNAFRAVNDKSPLKHDEVAFRSALKHSQDMYENNYFSHTGLNGSTPTDRYTKENNGIWIPCGENISHERSPLRAFISFANSPGHRANMLRDDYTHLGIGSYGETGAKNTQVFVVKR